MAPDRDPNSSIDRFKEEDEIDRLAREGGKSKWQEASAPAASDPVSDDEKRGLRLTSEANADELPNGEA